MNFGGTRIRHVVTDVEIDDIELFRAFVRCSYKEQGAFLLGLMDTMNKNGNGYETNLDRSIQGISEELDKYAAERLKVYMEKFVKALEQRIQDARLQEDFPPLKIRGK